MADTPSQYSEEREGVNPLAAFIPASASESFVIAIERIVSSLSIKYPGDARAKDTVNCLKAALSALTQEPYSTPVEGVQDFDSSPGVDSEGTALPPFKQAEFPSERGKFGGTLPRFPG